MSRKLGHDPGEYAVAAQLHSPRRVLPAVRICVGDHSSIKAAIGEFANMGARLPQTIMRA
jgi:hypothetical protein